MGGTEESDPFGIALLLCTAVGTTDNAALVQHGAGSKSILTQKIATLIWLQIKSVLNCGTYNERKYLQMAS